MKPHLTGSGCKLRQWLRCSQGAPIASLLQVPLDTPAHAWHPCWSLCHGGREKGVCCTPEADTTVNPVSEWELRFTAYPEECPKAIALQGQPLGLVLKNVENVRKKIFCETAEIIIMLAQNLSSSLIDLHKDDMNLMSLRFVLFCQVSLKLANRFKSYGAGGWRKTDK